MERNCIHPRWNEKFVVSVCHNAQHIVVMVKDREHVGSQLVGKFKIPMNIVLSGDPVTGWYDLVVGSQGEVQGSVHIWLQYSPVGVVADNGKYLLHDVYFSPQVNNRVTLYQDADTPPLGIFSGVTATDGGPYRPPRCWLDIFQAISQARRLIYITGWSLFTGISLLRGEDSANNEDSNVGELLKRKAAEGVRVLVMIWNEKSNDFGLLEGLMGTHDEDTCAFFAGSDLICANVPRDKASWLGLGGTFVSACYTHHQKTIICDAPCDEQSEDRRLVAFVGGLDITDGRYDTPEFPLYATINTLHAGDFYSNCTPRAEAAWGPRQPWHDIHAKVEGPAAMDICLNFMERWTQQNASQTSYLINVEADFEADRPGPYTEAEGGPWVVQVFRSITSDSALFQPARTGLLNRKYGHYVDNSIEKAYVNMIRNANNFIFIENQYFLGSAYSWYRDRETLSHHIIPRELAQRIIDKIKKRKDIKVYVCLPMYPEGDPSSEASQEILHWQHCTMESMYRKIARAISSMDMAEKHPTDYLNFFCLGKREGPESVPEDLAVPPEGTGAARVRQSLRHPVYVHSKLMIVDDDYIILGSANINQRSLGGNRDTEICIGAFQPSHTTVSGNQGLPSGGVRTFRTALWSAHLGGYNPDIEEPGSDTCLKTVRRIATDFWEVYTAETPQHSAVHLLPYPIRVLKNGKVRALDSPWDKFPDTTASVLGCKSRVLHAKLTT